MAKEGLEGKYTEEYINELKKAKGRSFRKGCGCGCLVGVLLLGGSIAGVGKFLYDTMTDPQKTRELYNMFAPIREWVNPGYNSYQ